MKRSFWIASVFLILAITAWAQQPTIIRKNIELCADGCGWEVTPDPANTIITRVNENITFTAAVTCPPGKVRKDPIQWTAGAGANPASGPGGSFTTKFTTPGDKTVTAECGECGSRTWNVIVLSIFEYKLREKIIQAANDQAASGIEFCWDGRTANCHPDNAFWKQQTGTTGGIELKDGVNPADAIDNLFQVQPAGKKFGVECHGALQMVWYKAILETFEELDPVNGRTKFNTKFPSIVFNNASGTSTSPPHIDYQAYPHYIFGDWRYVSNPDFIPGSPWQGENVIQMTNSDTDNDNFYGHPLGVETLAQIKQKLNENRVPGATREASLDNDAKRLNAQALENMLNQ